MVQADVAAAVADMTQDRGGDGVDDEAAAGESATVYVKNLAFATSDAALAAHFDAAVSAAGGRIRSARVSRCGFGKGCSDQGLGYAGMRADRDGLCMHGAQILCN